MEIRLHVLGSYQLGFLLERGIYILGFRRFVSSLYIASE